MDVLELIAVVKGATGATGAFVVADALPEAIPTRLDKLLLAAPFPSENEREETLSD